MHAGTVRGCHFLDGDFVGIRGVGQGVPVCLMTWMSEQVDQGVNERT